MTELLNLLYKWQTLIGSILGGLFALSVALIVAYSVRKREEVASGMLVVGNLAQVRNVNIVLEELAKKKEVPEKEYHLWYSEKLVHSHPSLSILFEASIARLMPVDVSMAAHLSLFHSIYLGIIVKIERLSEDFSNFHKTDKPIRPKDLMEADARLVTQLFKQVVSHASCAEHLITKLVLSKFSLFNRLRRYAYIKQEEKQCLKLLKEGSS